GHALLDGGGAEHVCLAELGQAGAFGVARDCCFKRNLTQLVWRSAGGTHRLPFVSTRCSWRIGAATSTALACARAFATYPLMAQPPSTADLSTLDARAREIF